MTRNNLCKFYVQAIAYIELRYVLYVSKVLYTYIDFILKYIGKLYLRVYYNTLGIGMVK